MQEEEYEVTPELITEISKKSVIEARKISRQVARILGKVAQVRKLILDGYVEDVRIIDVNNISVDPHRVSCYAIDSSFKSPLPLVFGDLFLVVGGYVRYPRVETRNTKINRGLRVLIRCREELTSRIQSAISKLVERRIALDILKSGEYDTVKWNTLIFDGPIVPLWPLILFTRSLYTQEQKLLDMSRRIIRTSRRKRKSIIGIIKRVRTHFIGRGIVKHLLDGGYLSGLKQREVKALKRVNDKALATLLLNPGEAMSIGKLGTSSVIIDALLEIGRKAAFDEFVDSNPWIRDVYVVFIKPKRSRHVVRLEILDYGGIGFRDILGWINENSSHTACPYILDVVDRYTAISNIIYELTRKIMIRSTAHTLSKLLKGLEIEEVDLLLELADLQKKYVPRMG